MALKSGIKSTEFYGSGFAAIVGSLAASGFLNPDLASVADRAATSVPEAVIVINAIVNGVMQLAGLAMAIIAPVKYNTGRAMAKKAPEKVVINK